MLLEGILLVAACIVMLVAANKKEKTILKNREKEKDVDIKKGYDRALKKNNFKKGYAIFMLLVMVIMVFVLLGLMNLN